MNNPNKEYDFSKVGKQMPYTVPEGSFDELEASVWERVKDELPRMETPTACKHHRSLMRVFTAAALSAAAAVAVFFVLDLAPARQTDSLTKVDKAFVQLSATDQDYILQVYQDDLVLQDN